ncbi:MAG TPA: hypothetical protein DHV36_16525 [Desulfobacteraceae bacterium]|nr:hypothetical protein [Desulfobacteraceae bacterium]|tara:strand:- start:101 stop:637 length:537 start_codon:yes stop_codon:yes gene_type:complete
MPRITPKSPETAQGSVKQGYEMFETRFGIIPEPLRMLSVSPALFDIQLARSNYFASQSNLSFSLLAHIRYMAARQLEYRFCTDLNKAILEKQGATEADFKAMEADPTQCLLEENEGAMLAFVVKAMKDPASITDQDVDALREFGWTDRDMVDAMAQGVSMIDHAIMMQVFDMNPHCLI